MAKGGNQVIAHELRDRGDAELRSLLAQKQDELQKLRFKHALQQLKTTHGLKALKRDIARLLTVLHARTNATQVEG